MTSYSLLTKLPLYQGIVERVDHDAKEYGIQIAMWNLLKRSHSQLIIHGLTSDLEEILTHKPVIVIANESHGAEMIPLFAAMPERKDAYILMNYLFTRFGKHLDEHFIPVYIRHHTNFQRRKFVFNLIQKIYSVPQYTREEEQIKNRLSIFHAAQKLKDGGLIIIFPGNLKELKHWYSGIGYLLRELGEENNAYVVNTYITGTTLLDVLRLVPVIGNCMPKFEVTFSHPIEAKKVYSDNAKAIVRTLEDEYRQWSEQLLPK